ncbi:PGAP1-like alpha/beta domain-containing protein [Thermospira aquatica]|uniref:GPI inositol-deacylase PGAP1-like alpha/beta domain-containing protein n=1 Tax=Thermospira aquatica TaxID=2828656 RepID=A0AAX3BE62_9SPIR|nr:hypothetical protein [Thermospira aquatica]URA10405.1 hypothetical protein KDW03_00960 [Thermospira aquatica]
MSKEVIWETRNLKEKTVSNLLPDEEYFVPIAVKCLGKNWKPSDEMTREGQKIVQEMQRLYFDHWNLPPWESFWDGSSSFRNMQTEKGEGYYDILRKRHKNGDKHILIGYSQGGVVARFLAFLDEYIYGNNLIDTVITIASPLQGSPLADPFHRETVTDAIIKILLSMLSFYESYDETPGYKGVLKFLSRIDFEDIYRLLSLWIEDSLRLAEISPYYTTIASYLSTFRKWLSGLTGNRESAFWELSPSRLLSPFSVLGLIQRPVKAKTASIITGNHSLQEIARDYLVLTRGRWIRLLWGIMKGWLLSQKVGGQTLYQNIQIMQHIYDREIMAIGEKEDHDFMVPSKRQTIEEKPSLGCFFIPEASHLSGKDPFSPGGKKIVSSVINALKKTICLP